MCCLHYAISIDSFGLFSKHWQTLIHETDVGPLFGVACVVEIGLWICCRAYIGKPSDIWVVSLESKKWWLIFWLVHSQFCRAKPKGSICLLYKWADTAFWLCRAELTTGHDWAVTPFTSHPSWPDPSWTPLLHPTKTNNNQNRFPDIDAPVKEYYLFSLSWTCLIVTPHALNAMRTQK